MQAIANEKAQEEAELLKEEGNGLFKASTLAAAAAGSPPGKSHLSVFIEDTRMNPKQGAYPVDARLPWRRRAALMTRSSTTKRPSPSIPSTPSCVATVLPATRAWGRRSRLELPPSRMCTNQHTVHNTSEQLRTILFSSRRRPISNRRRTRVARHQPCALAMLAGCG
jgi:hypothetical protein